MLDSVIAWLRPEIALAGAACAGALLAIAWLREHRRKVRRLKRRRRNLAYQRAWESIFGRRRMRITDQRPNDE